MLVANYTKVRNNLKNYCDIACEQNETVLITRKEEKNVIIISLERYNEMERLLRNIEYLNKLDTAFEQLEAGKGTRHELIEV